MKKIMIIVALVSAIVTMCFVNRIHLASPFVDFNGDGKFTVEIRKFMYLDTATGEDVWYETEIAVR